MALPPNFRTNKNHLHISGTKIRKKCSILLIKFIHHTFLHQTWRSC